MLNKIKIGPRLVLLIAIQTSVLLVIGATSLFGLNFATNTTESLNNNVIEQVTLNQINETVRGDLIEMLHKVSTGKTSWDEGYASLQAAKNLFVNNWDEYKQEKSASDLQELEASLGNEYQSVLSTINTLETYFRSNDRDGFNTYIESSLEKNVNPFLVELNERVNEFQILSEALFTESIETNKIFLYSSAAIILLGIIIASLLGFLIQRSIALPVKHISSTVKKVADGDYYARTKVIGTDELGELGVAFDGLLEDKVATLVQAEKDNEQLNESVISLLHAVSKLSQRDLTIKVPVTEDITGPVADALNQLTSETSKVLKGVRIISEEVAKASALVKNQSDTVIAVAAEEQREVDETSKELVKAAHGMGHIADLARVCNEEAENAINTTHTALETVTRTIDGINNIRETIRETEKRIKRLGERSQEISRAVNLINSISERTHILALNASMHAASAGEAGRGFAVVADEVQRLAENARDATSQISTLVSNIQVETADTVSTMNNVISQVVDGSRLAEAAGEQMHRTKSTTEELVDSVRQIARSSEEQSQITSVLQTRANQIKASTEKTSKHLQEQTVQTTRLVEYAKALLKAVQVFKLTLTPSANSELAAKQQSVLAESIEHRKAS